MKVLVQRVNFCKLSAFGELVSEIDKGLIVFLGVKHGDDIEKCQYLANKVANLRVFTDSAGKMNLSVKDVDGQIMVVSQFTLYGNAEHGFRPSFTEAEEPEKANILYREFVSLLKKQNVKVETGVFQADMKLLYENDGPVSVVIEK